MRSFIGRSRRSSAASRIRGAGLIALILAASMYAVPAAQQSPHGGSGVKPQPGPNVNAVGGIPADPNDPSALVRSDILMQRQNETVVAPSARNADHILAAANDYRFVDFPQDQFFGGQGPFSRLIARLFGPRLAKKVPARSAISVGGWTGIYRSCDRGASWIGSALPGSPLDNSAASLNSPLKALSNAAAAQGGHAETTDPVMVTGLDGTVHVFVLGFIRFPNGVGESRMYHASYTDRNNREGGTCFHYNFTTEVDRSTLYATSSSPAPFLDKPSVAIDKDGLLVVSYTVFLDSVKSKIVVARSTNRGLTWTKTMPFLQVGFLRNHGASTTIDPVRGTVLVAWRLFYQDWPLMVISRSFDRGRTFWPATPISHWWPSKSLDQIVAQLKAAKLKPFDQFTTDPGVPQHPTARALAFPHIAAGVVNGQGRLYAVWQERVDVNAASSTFGRPLATGSPRIVFTMSSDGGWSWTERKAIDAGPRTEHPVHPSLAVAEPNRVITRASGPQIQPVVSVSGTGNPQLLVLYYEDPQELAWPFDQNFLSGIERSMQVRVARVSPTTGQLLAPSIRVSTLPIKVDSSPAALIEAAPGMPVGDYQNVTIYTGGTRGFFGDYPHLVASAPFEFSSSWRWATEPSSSYTMWTAHHDVEFPPGGINGDWTAYTPLKPFTSGLSTPATCEHVAMRNANPYFAEIAGVVAGSPQTFKLLNIQRAFGTYVENRTPFDRYFRLTIHDDEAAGIDGSFKQFSFTPADDVQDVQIFSHSNRSQTIWVQPLPGNPTASLRMTVEEIDSIGGAIKQNGLRARLILNPDPNNDPLDVPTPTAPGFENVFGDTSEIHNPQVSAPQVSAFRIAAPQVSAPQVSAPQVSAPGTAAPQVSAPQVSAPQVSAPQVSAPQVSALGPGETNGTDVTFEVTNQGNTSTVYNAFLNVPDAVALLNSGLYNFQVLITRTSLVPTYVQTANGCVPASAPQVQVIANLQIPQVSAPQVSAILNPQVSAPQVSATSVATFSLAPEAGTEGQGSHGDANNEDAHSFPLVPRVDVTVRAIRLRDPIAADPVFDPNAVVLRVDSTSTNVVDGVVQPDGTQPGSVTLPDLVVANYAPAASPLQASPGGLVTLSSWALSNQGTAAAGAVGFGYYLSADPVITTADVLLGGGNVAGIPVGGQINIAAPSLTLPAGAPLGPRYIGILVDHTNLVTESNEGNNYVSEPITIVPAAPQTFVVTNTNTGGAGSLGNAIASAEAQPGLDTIVFDIPGGGPHTITAPIGGFLITDPVLIDATDEGACIGGAPLVQIVGTAADLSYGFSIMSTGSTLRGLSITRFALGGIGILAGGSNTIECSYVGLDPSGAVPANNNQRGILIASSNGNTIGGATAAVRNVISGNTGNGIEIVGTATGNQISGNYIGTDPTGTLARANGGNGVHIIDTGGNTIGGAASSARNVISGNSGEGVRIDGATATGNMVRNNYVGTTASGIADLGNSLSGIYVRKAPSNSILNNIVSGNDGFAGIAICGSTAPVCGGGAVGNQGSDASGNVVRGNYVGIGDPGSPTLGNAGYGVSIDGASNTVVGGTAAGEANTIVNSGQAGVVVFNPPAEGNVIRGNSIVSNGGLGIDLIGDGVSPNDAGDGDGSYPNPNEPNRLQNFPVLTALSSIGGTTTILGTLNSAPNQDFTIDFYSTPACSSSGNGEGAVYIGSATVTTNASNTAAISQVFPIALPAGHRVSATATDANGNTSEFSNCIAQGAGF